MGCVRARVECVLLAHGEVVHAAGGQETHNRPLQSQRASSDTPSAAPYTLSLNLPCCAVPCAVPCAVVDTGKMSKFLGELQVGDAVAFKGPIHKYPYSPNSKKEIGMVAGGE